MNTKCSFIENIRKNGIFRKSDLLLAVILLLMVISVLLIVIMPNDGIVDIYQNGKLIKSLSLASDTEFDVDSKLIVVIKSGKVHVEEATCPDKLCEHWGAISKAGMSITCLPNKIVVVIRGRGEVDGTT